MDRVNRIETWARLGYVARGLVYILLGWIALSSGKALSTGETVQAFEDLPAGSILLALLSVGLFGYGFYKIYSAVVDLDGHGSDSKGRAERIARGVGGLGYWILCFVALKELLGSREKAAESGQAAGSGGVKQDAATAVADTAGGDLLLILIGLVILAVAAAQFWIAYKAKFMDEMAGAPRLVKPAGQLGYAARALVIAIVGYFLVQAGLDGERLRSFGDALSIIRTHSDLLFKLIAFGLILFGFVSLAIARYRRIAHQDVAAGLSEKIDEVRRR